MLQTLIISKVCILVLITKSFDVFRPYLMEQLEYLVGQNCSISATALDQ